MPPLNQLGIIIVAVIIFLICVLTIIYQDEYIRKKLERKSTVLKRFWRSNNKSGERRKSIRINTQIEVLYEIVSNVKPQRWASITRNISLGGINLALNEKLFPGTILRLQLNIPKRTHPIFTQGEIVWVKKISVSFTKDTQTVSFATGIKFVQLNPKDELALKEFIGYRIKDGEQQTPYI